jgi:uncharacterized membrane protein
VGLLWLLVAAIQVTLMLYAAMAWGPNLIKNRLGGSFLCYIILYAVTQAVATIAMLASPLQTVIEDPQLYATGYALSPFAVFVNGMNEVGLPIIWISIAVGVVFSAGYFVLARFMLSKKLNLA